MGKEVLQFMLSASGYGKPATLYRRVDNHPFDALTMGPNFFNSSLGHVRVQLSPIGASIRFHDMKRDNN